MQRFGMRLTRVRAALIVTLVGVVLVVSAFVRVADVPLAAHDDFGALIRAQGGSMSHSATYPDTYRMMAAQSRMLQNAYLGFTGVALVTVGAIGAVAVTERRPSGP